jgi:hypothetical protein
VAGEEAVGPAEDGVLLVQDDAGAVMEQSGAEDWSD